MDETIKVKLPSGAQLEITPADFSSARRLYQALAKEAESLHVDPNAQVDVNLWKNVVLRAIGSETIDQRIWACIEGRCVYRGQRLTPDAFESVEARSDYLTVLYEVAVVNVRPFTKDLFARFADTFQKIVGILQSRFGESQGQKESQGPSTSGPRTA